MKKSKIFLAAAFGLASVVFAGCDFIDSVSGSFKETVSVSPTKTESWIYDSSRPIYVVTDDVLTLNISGDIGGKNLYFVQVNPTETAFESSDLRIVTNSSKLGSTISSYYSVASRSAENSDIQSITIDESVIDSNLLGHKHFVGEKLPSISDFSSSARSAVSSPSFAASSASTEKTWEVGDSKSIYVDTNSAMSTYVQKTAHLRAKSNNCYVWVVDDYYTTESGSGCKVNTAIAEEYASKFEEMYPYITNVFGKESEKIINYDSKSVVDMSTLSDTGTKINIVVYDIGADYGSQSTGSGVVGYFYAKDYYYTAQTDSSGSSIISTILGYGGNSSTSIITKSNVGKYFYIDSGFANSDFNTTISTLAHEFQHMIDFNQKNMKHTLSPETSYNEMLSMLCEDMMQEKLGLADYASPKNRIQSFNTYYYISGIREYLSDSKYSAYSYSTSYAFGSWLARQYGGAALVKEISQNEYVGNDSLVNAVNKVNGTSKSFDDLFAEFVLAVTGISSSYNASYTHNQNAKQTITCGSYSYPMKAFNLWSDASTSYQRDGEDATYTFSLKGTKIQPSWQNFVYSNYDFNGPIVLSATARLRDYDLRPEYGMLIHGVGKYASGATSDTLAFSSSGAEGLRLYIVIQ